MAVRNSVKLASSFRISPWVIGTFIIGFGTSLPELVVSMEATFAGNDSASAGNVIGSNMFNALFIVGLVACIKPIKASEKTPLMDIVTLAASVLLLFLFSLDRTLSKVECGLLVSTMLVYLFRSIFFAGKQKVNIEKEPAESDLSAIAKGTKPAGGKTHLFPALGVTIGMVALTFGASSFTNSAVDLARLHGLSDYLIGITILGIGTSLPELTASTIATLKGQADMAISNVVGSNIFNVLIVLGLSGCFSQMGVALTDVIVRCDIPVLIAVSLIIIPFFIYKGVSRWKGLISLALYFLYLAVSI